MSDLNISNVVSEIQAEFGRRVSPRVISNMFYAGTLRADLCPIVNGRRFIPRSYLPEIVRALQERGKLPHKPSIHTC